MHPPQSHRGPSPRVLVIDDDHALTSVLRKVLSDAGFDVQVANDGAEGLDKAADRPSIVLVDLDMPVMDGLEFVDAFRRLPGCAEVPIILATGTGDVVALRRRIEGKGVVFLMPKPFDLDTLIARVSAASRLAHE
jgi:two-component system, chemotaxis family, chemotaxis protein CheY